MTELRESSDLPNKSENKTTRQIAPCAGSIKAGRQEGHVFMVLENNHVVDVLTPEETRKEFPDMLSSSQSLSYIICAMCLSDKSRVCFEELSDYSPEMAELVQAYEEFLKRQNRNSRT